MEEDVEEDVLDSSTCNPNSSVEIMSYDRPPSAPPPPPSPPSVEIPIYSPFDEPPQYEPLIAAPVYKLVSHYVRVKVGESHRVGFTVTSEPPVPLNSHHVITHRDGSVASSRFKVKDNFIVFDNVRESDTDIYCISCKNEAGLEGNAVIQLEVFTGWPSSNAPVILSTPVVTQQPRWSPNTGNPRVDRGKKLGSYMDKWSVIFMFVVFVGLFLIWTLPCCIGVIVTFAVAGCKHDARQYEETEKCMKYANIWFVLWIISTVVGLILLITVLSLVL